MAEFSIPATPADEDLYNAVCNAAIELQELKRQYHEAECRRLDDLWQASQTANDDGGDA